MKRVWLQTSNKHLSHTQFTKVYSKEKLKIGETEIIINCDRNYQIISIDNHLELSFLRGRPYLLEIDLIKEKCAQ